MHTSRTRVVHVLPAMAAILCMLMFWDILSGFLPNLQQETLQVFYILYLFDVIIEISTINYFIEFITSYIAIAVVNLYSYTVTLKLLAIY